MPSADVLIIGSGIAAFRVAKEICRKKNVIILTKKTRRNNNTYLAQGGIAAAIATYDNPNHHYEDTLKAGCHYNNTEAVRYLVENGSKEIHELLAAGMQFDGDEKGLHLGKEGAHRKRRILHAGGDATGKHLLEHFIQEVTPHVTVIEQERVLDFIIENGTCRGVLTRDQKGHMHRYFAEYTVLATGGIGGLYTFTSNDETITGDGIAMVYRAGGELQDLEFMQFHPTMLHVDGRCCGLVSEAVRGEGAILVNGKGEHFMTGIHPQQDLAPRDVVARAIHSQLLVGEEVYLDISSIQHFEDRFPTVSSLCRIHGVNLKQNRIPVVPGAHFHMGGVKTNCDGETSIPRLYAAGETACNGVHGANRLASNSLLEGLVFGKRIGQHILHNSVTREKFDRAERDQSHQILYLPTKREIQEQMMRYVGIVRTEQGLLQAKKWFEHYGAPHFVLQYEALTNEEITIVNMLTVCWLMIDAALQRKESIGGHYRSDDPKRSAVAKEMMLIK
ncbi:L-aspartate oxidase [Bacillus cytotoxicus]|uniref:L-aspartate oxidase n=1 Tax=Bacillus cytotoxicus TaxID=580165 RepID=UPI0006604617|nr:L-aspartate oxidase [Bacillus cytotoxicus]AWC34016.1 L-aspartate oxidase [Bacillus cytotoxicus]AWC38016.1 L-aspartate oxidase [Bacillus cytotoxicus]AWC62229.1 L-aspartate oxidase [Bacillus cytotoxicus]KMT48941.1 L-aspartate oxidase [Bacillus cytotoxicus]HDR7309724.1 L-aspartate oxidase [Bacillus cytotoxicus]